MSDARPAGTVMAEAFARALADGASDGKRIRDAADGIALELRRLLGRQEDSCGSPPGEPSPSRPGGAESGPESSSGTGTAA